MGRGKAGKVVSILRKESSNPASLFKPNIPRKVREINSKLYASLRNLNSGWRMEEGFVTYEDGGKHVTCRYIPRTISHKSRKLYHQSEKYFFIHAGGLYVEPKKEDVIKYVGLEAEVTCFGRAVVVKSKAIGASEQEDIERIVKPLLEYIRNAR